MSRDSILKKHCHDWDQLPVQNIPHTPKLYIPNYKRIYKSIFIVGSFDKLSQQVSLKSITIEMTMELALIVFSVMASSWCQNGKITKNLQLVMGWFCKENENRCPNACMDL
ncbi:hypothetical protein DASC09_045520 [Saccharomycopsis crataegensis]|uniref:Uncharacterized protein n=1 Tax=Saccharomycopsis crataegensis TaxID=43959 RepID=A0AAV5QQS7_9ASCO|nr:hypothetical protein DASC09_045520 [Saccharomycopsis crataegensis]